MNETPDHVERGGDVRPDTPDRKSEDDTARQEQGAPTSEPEQGQGKGHGPLKGTDTLATTAVSYIDREKGKRTTM